MNRFRIRQAMPKSRRARLAVPALLCALLAAGGCSLPQQTAPVSHDRVAAFPAAASLTVGYDSPGKGQDADAAFLRESRTMEDLADRINSDFLLPAPITITGTSCGAPDAYYDPAQSGITICYEYVRDARDGFTSQGAEDVDGKVLGLLTETVFHEAGHALIDKLALPITGREEDVADQFAAYMLIGTDMEPRLRGALADYERRAEAPGGNIVHPSDEHSPNGQRSGNYRCYLYGAAPDRNSDLVDGTWLTEDRAQMCGDTWHKLQAGLDNLLDEHRAA
ncbi:DUF4344 domain-containing metallopeptidase [Marinactinospora rubrisoli]|uniref:DUF4344 domain-containing metallopeptidase n=1 Tax=Marinactinospora rubrisoli TaxID=2715399 RepID=A0ABW2KCT8_9ACTN